MRVLITGATGFIGNALTEYLLDQGLEIHYLTTSKDKIKFDKNYRGFYWNPEKNEIDVNCIQDVDVIFNLSGKSINCQWSKQNKNKILKSRIDSAQTLYKLLSENPHQVKKIICASAIGIYPSHFTKIQNENGAVYNDDFLGMTCAKWEAENLKFNALNLQVLIVRFGLVLSDKEGVLPKFTKIINSYMGCLLGGGNQWYSWIHITDLVRILNFGIYNQISGIVNGVSPNPKTQKQFFMILAGVLKKPMFFYNIPTFLLRLFVGERSDLITNSHKIGAERLLKSGFVFKYPILKDLLKDFYRVKKNNLRP